MSRTGTVNKISSVMEGWHAIEYATAVQIFTPSCEPYMKLYKKSTPDAVDKARHFITIMNELTQLKESVNVMLTGRS